MSSPVPPAPDEALALRRTFSRFATGVTVVTARAPAGQLYGVTASSFNTVSLTPPIVLWSLSQQAPSLAGFRAAGRFVIHVLGAAQLALAQRFAQPAPAGAADKFAGLPWRSGLHGQPLLPGCAATLECRITAEHAVGDHVLFLGAVERHTHADTPALLLFCNGRFQQPAPLSGPHTAKETA